MPEMQIHPSPSLFGLFKPGIEIADIFMVQKIQDAFFNGLRRFAVRDLHGLYALINGFLYSLGDLLFHIGGQRIEVYFEDHLLQPALFVEGGERLLVFAAIFEYVIKLCVRARFYKIVSKILIVYQPGNIRKSLKPCAYVRGRSQE